MITDFSAYTSAGLQNITYHGKNSLSDYGVLIASGTQTNNLNTKSVTESISHQNGQIDESDMFGKKYEARVLTYRFKLVAESREKLRTKESAVKAWLDSDGDKRIADSDYLETITSGGVTSTKQWYFQKCYLKSIEVEEGEKAECEYEYLTATFECDPLMVSGEEVNERVLKFTASGTASLTVTNNSAYSLTADGVTTTGSISVTSPYKYRLVCFVENPETITLNGSAIAAGEIFTMPSSAEIIISAVGYKYVELWHDTRTGVRL